MQMQIAILEAEMLKLTAAERARLARLLIASLDEDTEIEESWAMEVEKRIAGIGNGETVLLPADEVLAQARAALK